MTFKNCVCYGFNFHKYFIALNSKARRKNEIGQDFGGRYSIRFWHFSVCFKSTEINVTMKNKTNLVPNISSFYVFLTNPIFVIISSLCR